MVDRTGVKITLQEKYSRNSTGVYGLVAEQVANLDENMALVGKAAKTLPTGNLDQGGPPTSLSPSGKDRLLFFLASFSRDTTHFVNGTQLGDRQTFQVASLRGSATQHVLYALVSPNTCLPSFIACTGDMPSTATCYKWLLSQTLLFCQRQSASTLTASTNKMTDNPFQLQ